MIPMLAAALGLGTDLAVGAGVRAAAGAAGRGLLTQAARSLLPQVGRSAAARVAASSADDLVGMAARRRGAQQAWKAAQQQALYGRQGGMWDYLGGSASNAAARAVPEVAMNGLFALTLPPEYSAGDRLALAASGAGYGLLGGMGAAGTAAKLGRRMGMGPAGVQRISGYADMGGSMLGSVLPVTGLDPITNGVNDRVNRRLQEQQDRMLAGQGAAPRSVDPLAGQGGSEMERYARALSGDPAAYLAAYGVGL